MSTFSSLVCHPNSMAKLKAYSLLRTQEAHRYLTTELVQAFSAQS